MRQRLVTNQLTLQAIAGSHVVMLGFSLPQALCTGLLGFAVHRTDHDEQEANWLRGKKTFLATDPGLLPGASAIPRASIPCRASRGATSRPSPIIATPIASSR